VNKIRKIHFIVFAILILISIAGNAYAVFDLNKLLEFPPSSPTDESSNPKAIQQIKPLNANITTQGNSSLVRTTCAKFPGLFNKLVKCMTSMTTREVTFFTIWKISNIFASAANAMLVVYIVFFGLRMSMNALENNKNDIIVFLLTCFFITFANNHVRIIDGLKFFMTVQNEFAYAATAALYSSQDLTLKKDITKYSSATNEVKEEIRSKYACYGPLQGKDELPTPGKYHNIWQRMDCLIGYMLGMHPLVRRMSEFTTDIGEKSIQEFINSGNATTPSSVQSALNSGLLVIQNLGNTMINDPTNLLNAGAMSGKYSYELFSGKTKPFANMIEDPFCWSKGKPDISFLQSSDTTLSKVLKLKDFIQDQCFVKRMGLESLVDQINAVKDGSSDLSAFSDPQFFINLFNQFGTSMLTKPYPTDGDKYQVTLASSFIVILVGSLFSSTVGFFSFILGFGVILLMFFAFAQAAMVYITSLFAILFLGLFAPIIIPLFLFKNTRGIFESWLQMFFVYSLQPGLLLCYLTMMILVLQFVVFEKHKVYNPNSATQESVSFIDLILGDTYIKADKSRKAIIEIYEKVAAGKDNSMSGIINAGNQSTAPFVESSLYGSGEAEYYVAGIQEAVSSPQNPFGYGLLGLNNSGGSSSSISLPSLNFFGGDFGTGVGARQNLANAATRDLVQYKPTASDLSAIFKGMQAGETVQALGMLGLNTCFYSSFNTLTCKGPTGSIINIPLVNGAPDLSGLNYTIPLNLVAENLKKLKQQEARYKLLFIQSLFIIFITLAVTISFMHTVMEIAGKLAGASATPIGKATGIYGVLADRIQKMAMKTG
jgi:type IV secretory pathway VirB6-like protein